MRPVLAALALTACATSAAPDVPAALRGCWIAHEPGRTVTMRWFPDGASWRGDELFYAEDGGEPAHQGYRIDATAGESERGGWAICPLDDGLPHGAPCRALYFGHAVDAYHAEIHAGSDRLRFAFYDDGQETLLFDGVRDGCD